MNVFGMLGASPQEITRLTAEAALAADTLYWQTRDPMDRLVLNVQPDGTYTTETVRNRMMRESESQAAYSQHKTVIEYVVIGALGLGVVAGLYYFLK